MSAIPKLRRNEKIIKEDGALTERAYLFFANVADLNVLVGSGSPEGVLEAPVDTLYKDASGSAGSILYVKKDADVSGDRTQGWILV